MGKESVAPRACARTIRGTRCHACVSCSVRLRQASLRARGFPEPMRRAVVPQAGLSGARRRTGAESSVVAGACSPVRKEGPDATPCDSLLDRACLRQARRQVKSTHRRQGCVQCLRVSAAAGCCGHVRTDGTNAVMPDTRCLWSPQLLERALWRPSHVSPATLVRDALDRAPGELSRPPVEKLGWWRKL